MPTLAVDNFNIVCAILGGFIALFGLVSYLCKERFYLSETLISLIAGAILSPSAANLIRPLQYAFGDEDTLSLITLYFARLTLGIQLVIAGVQLPSKYLRKEWKSLVWLLGPGMVAMWLCSSLIIWALVPHITFVYALVVGACVTPTDPVLASNIVKGKFADKNIPKELQNIIIAESGANDGLGYPFLFLPLYLIQYVEGGKESYGKPGTAIGKWFYEIWVYEIILGTVYGATVGWIAKELLHWAERKRYVDRESFIVFAFALALFIVGTAGLVGTDDVLACFIAGNTFTWDDWFRVETQDDSLQPTIDMLLNVSVFIWIGAVCPWDSFAHNDVVPIYRLIFIGVLVLLFRRLPFVLAIHKQIHQIEEWRQAIFVGFFGPIGVSAVFYLYVAMDFLKKVEYDDNERDDARKLGETINVIVWFLIICSALVHGLTIPVGKLGLYLPRTFSRAISANSTQASFTISSSSHNDIRLHTADGLESDIPAPRPIWHIGGTVMRNIRGNNLQSSSARGSGPSTKTRGSRATSPSRRHASPPTPASEPQELRPVTGVRMAGGEDVRPTSPLASQRTIWFPDENPPSPSFQMVKENGKRKKGNKEDAEEKGGSIAAAGESSSAESTPPRDSMGANGLEKEKS